MEHRWGQRVRIDLPIWIKGSAFGKIGARLIDLSVSGAFVAVNVDIRILCQIRVATIVPHLLASNTESLEAHVIRKEYQGIAIEWAAFAPATFRMLLESASQWREAQRRLTDLGRLWVYVAMHEELAATPGMAESRRPPRRVGHAASEPPVLMSTNDHASL
jgi:hypothetical protein